MKRLALYRQRQDRIRDVRRKIVLELIMRDPDKKWTAQAISEAAKEHKWFKEFMPTYSAATARSDLLAVLNEIKSRREELAEQYLAAQLDIVDDEIRSIQDDLDSLGDVKSLVDGDDVSMNDILKFVRAKATMTNTLLRLLEHQNKLVPVEIPKRVDVNQQIINLDMFLEARKELNFIDDGMTVDGEVIDE